MADTGVAKYRGLIRWAATEGRGALTSILAQDRTATCSHLVISSNRGRVIPLRIVHRFLPVWVKSSRRISSSHTSIMGTLSILGFQNDQDAEDPGMRRVWFDLGETGQGL